MNCKWSGASLAERLVYVRGLFVIRGYLLHHNFKQAILHRSYDNYLVQSTTDTVKAILRCRAGYTGKKKAPVETPTTLYETTICPSQDGPDPPKARLNWIDTAALAITCRCSSENHAQYLREGCGLTDGLCLSQELSLLSRLRRPSYSPRAIDDARIRCCSNAKPSRSSSSAFPAFSARRRHLSPLSQHAHTQLMLVVLVVMWSP